MDGQPLFLSPSLWIDYMRHLRVALVAARLGFASEAHFSRAFRSAFGRAPSEVRAMAEAARAQGLPPQPLAADAAVEYADWLVAL